MKRQLYITLFLLTALFGNIQSYFEKEWLMGNHELITQLSSPDKALSLYPMMPATGIFLIESGYLDALYTKIINSRSKSAFNLFILQLFNRIGSPTVKINQRIANNLSINELGQLVGLGQSGFFNDKHYLKNDSPESMMLLEKDLENIQFPLISKLTQEINQLNSQRSVINANRKKLENQKKRSSREITKITDMQNKQQLQEQLNQIDRELAALPSVAPITAEFGSKKQYLKYIKDFLFSTAETYYFSNKNDERDVSIITLFLTAAFCFIAQQPQDLIRYFEGIQSGWQQSSESPFTHRIDSTMVSFTPKQFTRKAPLSFVTDPDETIYEITQAIKLNKNFPPQIGQKMVTVPNGSFTDCAEATLHNLLNVLLYDAAHNNFKFPDNLKVRDDFLEYYKTISIEKSTTLDASNEWAALLANLPEISYLQNQCEVSPSLTNFIKIFSYIFPEQGITANTFIEFLKLFSTENKIINAAIHNNTISLTIETKRNGDESSIDHFTITIDDTQHAEMIFPDQQIPDGLHLISVNPTYKNDSKTVWINTMKRITGFILFNILLNEQIGQIPLIPLLIQVDPTIPQGFRSWKEIALTSKNENLPLAFPEKLSLDTICKYKLFRGTVDNLGPDCISFFRDNPEPFEMAYNSMRTINIFLKRISFGFKKQLHDLFSSDFLTDAILRDYVLATYNDDGTINGEALNTAVNFILTLPAIPHNRGTLETAITYLLDTGSLTEKQKEKIMEKMNQN